MPAIAAHHLSYAYGRTPVLRDLTLEVPAGSVYALLGANGSGKTTLLQLLMGLRRPRSGSVSLLGMASHTLTTSDRARIGYVAEGQPLPAWMTLAYLERYLAPLYPRWDHALARELRERFSLDPQQRVGSLSRGEHMKAALLCALAPRPELLVMDEPFTGLDAVVKDDLVRGLLGVATGTECTVIVASHDIGELELLADRVGILQGGRLCLDEPMERVRERFRRVNVVADAEQLDAVSYDPAWLASERAGRRWSFVVSNADEEPAMAALVSRLPESARFELQELSLRELFVVLSRPAAASPLEVAA